MTNRAIDDDELAIIAAQVRAKLEARFGPNRIKAWISFSPEIAQSFVAEIYIAVREKLLH